MSDQERDWKIHELRIPKGTCPHCPYVIWIPGNGKVSERACTERIYTARGQHDIARHVNTKGIPKDCQYLNGSDIE